MLAGTADEHSELGGGGGGGGGSGGGGGGVEVELEAADELARETGLPANPPEVGEGPRGWH